MDAFEWRQAAKQRFDFDNWAQNRPIARAAPHARNFAFDVREVPGWTLERRSAYGDRQYADDLAIAGEPLRHVRISINECADASSARLALLDLLAESMAPTLPRLKDGLVGEVAFMGHDGDNSAVTFVRDNIVVSVRSTGRETISVLDLASNVDLQIIRSQQ